MTKRMLKCLFALSVFPQFAWGKAELVATHKSSSEVTLLFVGDQGSGNSNQHKVAALMESLCERRNVDAIFLLGDNFFDRGVQSVTDSLWQKRFESVYSTPCLKKLKFFAVLGNHDYEGKPKAQIEYSHLSSQWVMPGHFYSVRFGKLVEMVLLDTNKVAKCFLPICGYDWAQKRLQLSQAKWTGLAGHHPFIGNEKNNPTFPVRTFLPRTLCKGGGSFYVAGHIHLLQHATQEKWGCELHQFISGAGGSPLEPRAESNGDSLFETKSTGVIVGTFTETQAEFEIITTEAEEAVYRYSF